MTHRSRGLPRFLPILLQHGLEAGVEFETSAALTLKQERLSIAYCFCTINSSSSSCQLGT
jgi:hypothetical protein